MIEAYLISPKETIMGMNEITRTVDLLLITFKYVLENRIGQSRITCIPSKQLTFVSLEDDANIIAEKITTPHTSGSLN